MRFGLTTRLLIATGALALIGVAAFVALLLASADVNRARASVANSQAELAQVREIRNQLLDMETGQRGFIITGQQRFLEPWEASRQRLPEDFARLRRIVDDPNQARRAEQLQRDALAYVNDYSLPLVDAARRGDPSVRGLAASDDGKQRMDALRGELNAYQTAEGSLIVAQQAKSDRAYIRGAVLAGAGLVAAIAVAALITAYLARGVVRPVRRTALMAERLAAGDLAARVPQTG
ncbi:CHASE3 domain-containing protein, partial [Mycobacterium sp.]|uniref:CHASE3 domain-containing protein n=1 Tax=Mycobacterium sp. TaxID=1785 RepID=UPI002D469963